MTCRKELSEILERHRMWLNGEEGGERANLQGADLYGAGLQRTDLQHAILRDVDFRHAILQRTGLQRTELRGADLRRADMRGTDIDYASWPLWCGSLEAYVDDRIAIQLLYHTLSVVQHSPFVSEEVKKALLSAENARIANRFHRVGECGEIEEWERTKKNDVP